MGTESTGPVKKTLTRNFSNWLASKTLAIIGAKKGLAGLFTKMSEKQEILYRGILEDKKVYWRLMEKK